MRYLISGGGTGGHIFPAVSIANALKELDPEAEILFIGALGRMEMERVPQAGYKIIGLPVRGFNRAQPYASATSTSATTFQWIMASEASLHSFSSRVVRLLTDM